MTEAPYCTGRIAFRHEPVEMVRTNEAAQAYKCLICDTIISFGWSETEDFPEYEQEKMKP